MLTSLRYPNYLIQRAAPVGLVRAERISLEKVAPLDREKSGPFDVSEVGLLTPYLDFGSIRIAPKAEMQIRADVDEANKRIVAITVEINKHRMQLQAFAATRSEGLWLSTIEALSNSVTDQGGESAKRSGPLGIELFAQVPNPTRNSVFIGVDGPRWFLRGVITGDDLSGANYLEMISIFRQTVVNRGDVALPPGDLLPLKLPVGNE